MPLKLIATPSLITILNRTLAQPARMLNLKPSMVVEKHAPEDPRLVLVVLATLSPPCDQTLCAVAVICPLSPSGSPASKCITASLASTAPSLTSGVDLLSSKPYSSIVY
ncbi:hypothetical protein B0H19DRAFT_1272350 [Mycena capillaripes]|nr:hypothetical protein B0H19DRAFT_1272350 [Mycena capillaripes]